MTGPGRSNVRRDSPADDSSTPDPGAGPPTRRGRRAPGRIRELILDAARSVFADKGYPRATTREIAAAADVAETLLFRNFGSKANLFGEAVLVPMAEFLEHWVEWAGDESNLDDSVEGQEQFTRTVYRTARANRGLVLTALATSYFEPEVMASHPAGQRVRAALRGLTSEVMPARLDRLGVDTADMNVPVAAGSSIAMILAAAVFDDHLIGADFPDDDDAIVRELTRQILYGGFNVRPA
ncbi:MAG: TetR/AcrR family transcriptional regulator [Acidimicrobiales bacterium]